MNIESLSRQADHVVGIFIERLYGLLVTDRTTNAIKGCEALSHRNSGL